MRYPAALSALDEKAGLDWSPDEIDRAVSWWREPEQEKFVWYCAARYLGAWCTTEDVEEAWLDFYSTLMERARASYKPVGLSFCTYLVDVCFKNHCVQRGERIRRRAVREMSLTDSDENSVLLQLQLSADELSGDPAECAQQTAFLEALNAALNEPQINPRHRQAFLLRYVEELTYPNIASLLDAPEGSVKVWVHRITRRIAARLKDQGWSE